MSDQQKESIKLDAQFETTKGLIIQTIENSEKSVNDCMKQKDICMYHWMMIISTIAFLLLMVRVYLCDPCKPAELEVVYSIVLKMFSMLVLSLLFIWWMKYLNKLISDCRDAMKPWQKTISDTYAFLIEMEKMLHKAECEKQKKNIEKSEADKLSKEDVDKLVEQRIEEMKSKVLKEKTIVDQWVVRLKDTDPEIQNK